MSVVQLRTLGECALDTHVGRLGPGSKFVFALGLYTVLERGRRIPRQALVDLLWPDVDERQARHRFRQTLLRLKQIGVPITAEQSHVLLERRAATADFESLLELNGDAEAAVSGRHSFVFLPGYQPVFSEQFGSWLELQRARIHLAVQRVFVQALKNARARGDWLALEALAISCLRLDPLNEEATMARAEATVMRGSKAQALTLLDNYMDALGEKALAIGLPAKILRARIADRLLHTRYATLSERHFVGREHEIALLTNALEQARQGRGGAFLFTGEAGIGKSRLLDEVIRIAELKGIATAAVRCQPTDVDRPVTVLASLVPALRGLRGSLGVSVHSLALLQRLTEYNEPAECGTDVAETGADGAAIRRAVFDLFDAVADENTVLVTVEDAHWADRFSWKVLRMLAEWSSRHHVVIIVTSRQRADGSEQLTVLEPVESFHTRPLSPLSYAAAESLVTMLMQDQGSEASAEMLRWCVTVSEGNPYYLRELLTRWLETGEPFGVPQSLSELIDRKLGTLSSDALRLMQVCVTLGKWCTLGRLERVEATDPPQLLRALEELAHAGVVTSDGTRVLAKHDLLSQAARKCLSEPLKMLIHRRIAGVLESEGMSEPVPALLWECAHHWEMAGEIGRAVDFLDECGRHLISVGLPEEAAELYRRAVGIPMLEWRATARLHEGLIGALRQSGLLNQVLREIASLRDAARSAKQELPTHSSLELTEVEARWRTAGATPEDLQQLLTCIHAPDASPVHRLQAAYWALAFAQNLGQATVAAKTWQAVVGLVQCAAHDPAARYRVAMVYHADYGNLVEAVEYADRLVATVRASGSSLSLIRALRNGAVAVRRAGHMDRARSFLTEAYDLAVNHHATLAAVEAAHQMASLCFQEGELRFAWEWLNIADSWTSRCESPFQTYDLAITRACLALTDTESAESVDVRPLLERVPSWQDDANLRRRQLVASLHLLIAARHDATLVRPVLLTECERLYTQLGNRGNQDFCVECLVTAYVAVDDRVRSRQLLKHYLKDARRDRGPLPPTLAAQARVLGDTTR